MKIYLESSDLPFWLGVIKARINEGINQVTLIELELASRDELKPKDMDGLIGKPITFFVEDIINNSLHKTRFDGLIFEMIDVTGGKTVQGIYYYTMVIRPPLWTLNYFVHSRSFTDTTRIKVIDDLLKEHGLAPNEHYTTSYRSEKVYPPFHQILQTGNSDLAFFKETLANAGINYYFGAYDEAEKPEQLHLVDDNAFFAPYEETIPIVDAGGMVQNERRVEHITRLTRALPTRVRSTAYLGLGSNVSKTCNQILESSGTDGEIHVFIPEGGKDRSGVAKQAAKVKAEGFSAQKVVHRGVSDHMRVRPGKRVKLRSFATAREYEILVTEVRHTFEQNTLAALDVDASNEPTYKNYFTAAEPRSPVRPASATTEVDIDFALDAALDLDLNGKVSINPKFEMNNEFNFNPTFSPEINTKGIGMLLAAVAGLQAQISSLKRQVASLKSGAAVTDNVGLTSGAIVGPGEPESGELTCKVQLDGTQEIVTAKAMALWHTNQGGLHFLPRVGKQVWVQRVGGSKCNDWVVIGYRPTTNVPIANAPSANTKIKGLQSESAPVYGSPADKIVSPKDKSVKNTGRIGFMGEKNIAEIFIEDGEGLAVSRAKKNIYQQCDEEHHIRSAKLMHEVSGDAWQQLNSFNQLVSGDLKVCVGGNRELTMANDDKKHVLKKQELKVDKTQDVTIGEGQKTTITKGDREITVANGNLTETVNGENTRSITKDSKWTFNSKTNWVKLGDVDLVNGSMENGVTIGEKIGVWLGGKAEVDLGYAEKLNVGGINEQTFSVKRTDNFGLNLVNDKAAVIARAPIKSAEISAVTKFKAALQTDEIKAHMKKCKVSKHTSKLVFFG